VKYNQFLLRDAMLSAVYAKRVIAMLRGG